MTEQKKLRARAWAIGWLEKMSIVTIFNGLFAGSFASFLIGIVCAAASLFFSMQEGE